ncbi:Eco57I restriction-modification methylase domain-containing protein [Cellulomonas fimi]|uniref:Eco57I restriction endonuclease n=1 Tax=Cellulomonas fimi (strain ATCC 484 / DSM 20113 / JCM 1341 / CCUG 24087 / LMG 16345 / NBRC 15513 / NCIMB 8980 / NCTC 7547 / NRS-133) TaxID=590998 RepID=F4H3W8_CELFA|nr:Eco57I restriction-modification methylase domain-containing protein [Cellulomonas fimi]AEE44192.1 Eco57I restriction endonuclease [Cellulomonas fimi ATCC 484]NNH05642.1 restriction endonuclease [Cellulomonas fimi]VEH25854.1 Eco57I restriction-modification methylase [Cellulomonas fimi]
MAKKFDVVIGNPPYQAEAQGEGTRDTPIYHEFMDAAYEVAKQAVIITPARFLSDAGFTPKAWNAKMLADEHLTVAHFEPDSNRLFPGLTDPIKGGIAVTHRDSERKLGPIGFFTKSPELNTVLHKVLECGATFIDAEVSSGRAYAFTKAMHDQHPEASSVMSKDAKFRVSTNAFDQLAFLFHENRPEDGGEYMRILGVHKNRRVIRWIRREYLTTPRSSDRYKVAIPAANGSGSTTDFFGVALNKPTVLGPSTGVTQTFVTIGSFDTETEGEACLRYIKSKFARAMLGILKVTQHNPRATWKFVPVQDFTPESDIDWQQDIPGIDAQLYAKYGLADDEIAFIEANVRPME